MAKRRTWIARYHELSEAEIDLFMGGRTVFMAVLVRRRDFFNRLVREVLFVPVKKLEWGKQ